MMGFYVFCWSIIELYLIPDNFVKWFYLSFYIHLLLLVICWFFLGLKAFKEFLIVILLFSLNSLYFLCVCIYKFCSYIAVYCFSFFRVGSRHVNSRETFEPAEVNDEDYQIFHSFSFSYQVTSNFELKEYPARDVSYKVKDENDEYSEAVVDFYESDEEPQQNWDIDLITDDNSGFSSGCCSEVPAAEEFLVPSVIVHKEDSTDMPSPAVMWSWPESIPPPPLYSLEEEAPEMDLDERFPSVYEYNLAGVQANEDLGSRQGTGFYLSELDWTNDEPTADVGSNSVLPLSRVPDTIKDYDPFYGKYTERMRWFDLVSLERTCGIRAIAEKQFDYAFIPDSYISWGKTARKRLLKSIKSDLELAYVAQMCLSWEALHHQHRKVHELLLLGSACPQIIRTLGHMKLAAEFQNFQVLIERFLEEERRGSERYLKFVDQRFSFKSFLQVPGISGNLKAEEDLKALAKALENCIKAFCIFVKTDKGKPWWKIRSSLWSHPPVEDPRDLKLLHELLESHHKKVLLIKDVRGKSNCWIKRQGSTGESQKEELYATIDLRLVSRVLEMATISSSQLKWCRSKLDDVIFQNGKVVRGSACPLFPTS